MTPKTAAEYYRQCRPRLEAFWGGQCLGRPAIHITAARNDFIPAPPADPDPIRRDWNIATYVERARQAVHGRRYYAETVPYAFPSLKKRLIMTFKFAIAQDLYRMRKHPRLFIGPDDIERLREISRRGIGRKIMAGMRRRVKPLVTRVLESDNSPKLLGEWAVAWNMPGTNVVSGAQDIAAVGMIGQDDDAMEAALRIMRASPRADDYFPKDKHPLYRYSTLGGSKIAPAYDLVCEWLTDAEREAFARWAYRTCVRDVLERVRPNYYLQASVNTPMARLYTALSMLLAIDGEPGVPDISEPRDELIRMLDASLHGALGADGYPEEDIGYGSAAIGSLSQLAEATRRAGLYDPWARTGHYARSAESMLYFVQPWGDALSNTGDHSDLFGDREFPLAVHAQERNNPTLLWLLGTLSYDHGRVHPKNTDNNFSAEVDIGRGLSMPPSFLSLLFADRYRDAKHPRQIKKLPTAYRDRTRGIVTLRSSWKDDATFVVLDGSQRRMWARFGHAHASAGHFSLSALGEYFSIDTGRYNIEQSCHSVVLADGKSGEDTKGEWRGAHRPGLLTGFAPGRFVDTASVDSSSQHNAFWARRTLGMVKGPGAPAYVFVADDICKDHARREYWWQLQTAPENRIRTFKDHASIQGHRHGNRLDVHFDWWGRTFQDGPYKLVEITQDEGLSSSSWWTGKGWKGSGDPHEKAKAFARPADMIHGPVYVRPRLLVKFDGSYGRYLFVMLPRLKGNTPAKVKRLAAHDGTLALRITFENVEDTLIYAFDQDILRAGGVDERGQWSLQRRELATDRILFAVTDRT